MAEFRMPSLGADMAAGTLIEWYVKPGDAIKRGELIAVVETDKANVDVESFESGTVDRLLVEPGQKVPVGTPLAYIRADGEAAAAPAAGPAPAPAPAVALASAAAPPPAARVLASPAARKLARERRVDLAAVAGTGPHGIVQLHDVEAAVAATPPPAAAAEAAPAPAAPPMSEIRRAIAVATSKANREIPHYYLQTRIDLRAAREFLEQHNAQRSLERRVLPAALLYKATALALRAVPQLNGFWTDGALQVKSEIHLGMAVSLRQGGLMVAAIHNADVKAVDEIMEAMRDLITRVRSGRLRSSEITDATVTVTNLGDLGVETVYGVIYPPQVALIGFGRVTEQAWAADGMLGVRPVVSATLAADHRATDGHDGAQFLTRLAEALQEPEAL